MGRIRVRGLRLRTGQPVHLHSDSVR
ncbi:hypothetical protein [Bifidobacterium pullorum]